MADQINNANQDDMVPPDQPKPEPPAQSKDKKSNGARIAVLVAVLIAIALVALGYYAYQLSGTETDLFGGDDSNQSEAEKSPESEDGPAEAEDVDEAVNDIDEELEALDEEDFDNSDLEDDSLGL